MVSGEIGVTLVYMWEALVCVAAQLSVRLLFLSGDEEGDGGDVGCYLGLCGCHLDCVAVQLDLRTFPLFAAVLAFSADYFAL